ncbi:MAG: hypothetical protein JXB07_08940 [Anaerolineae bacterium]|nr:hypothetical protein [Anaerolineae bacterium]
MTSSLLIAVRRWSGLILLLLFVSCRSIVPSSSPTPPIPSLTPGHRNDRLLVGEGSIALHRLMESGEIRHVRDWAAFIAFGFQMGDVTSVPPDQMAAYPIGAPLTRWVTGVSDPALYVLVNGRRYLIDDLDELAMSAVSPVEVSLLPDDLLVGLPLAESTLDPVFSGASLPIITATTWWQGGLWVADESGQMRTWQDDGWQPDDHRLPDGGTIRALATNTDHLYVGTNRGSIWTLDRDAGWQLLAPGETGWISALALDRAGSLWYADSGHYDRVAGQYQVGRGLMRLDLNTLAVSNVLMASSDAANDPLRSITALAWDREQNRLWVGTRFGGLYSYHPDSREWQHYTSFESGLAGNAIVAFHLVPDIGLRIATDGGVQLLSDGTFTGPSDPGGVLSIASSGDTIWAAGANVIAYSTDGQDWQSDKAFDTPELLDRFTAVVIDDAGWPWFIGERRLIRFDGRGWQSYDTITNETFPFVPGHAASMVAAAPALPSPRADYTGWLRAWPRPQADNGRGLHYLQGPSGDEFEVRLEIARLQRLGVRWVLVNYTERAQLLMMAPLFEEAGMMVIWRPFVHPYEAYEYWAEDVAFLLSQGIAPYIQVYNEPNLEQEWDGRPIDQDTYQSHMLSAVQEVVDAGGLAGLQHIDATWLREDLRRLKGAGLDSVFDRLFFVPHPYGANHPPDYDQDNIGVLSFREPAGVFQEEIGFVPPMIAGEGGWRLGDAADTRYPAVDEALHRDYHVAVFNWFHMGILSNGEPLPDYLFAFCPWLLSDPNDPAAWFDSMSGDRALTIQGVTNMPNFVRKFSWEEVDR